MRILSIILLLLFSISIRATSNTQAVKLSGRITDIHTGEAVAGAVIYLPDLKIGTISDSTGIYKFENLPLIRVLVQVSFVGYKNAFEFIDLSLVSYKDFALEHSITEMNEVVVTGLSKASELKRTPTPISIVSKSVLLQNVSNNIIDAIAKQSGISQITTGSGISKPVIRGLGYNRVVVVNDDIRQEGHQWGDEHGIEIDENSVSKVEILKGPASLAYGSDAMAGVINIISDASVPEGKIAGNISSNYQTNNGLIGYSADLARNSKGFIWNFRYSNKMAHAYQNKFDGYVFNSGYKENSMSGLVGLNKSWGYSHITLSVYNFTPGIIEGERDSLSGKFLKPIAINDTSSDEKIASDNDFKSYTPLVPYQKVHHYKAIMNSNFIIGNGSLKTTFGFQQNQRQEYADILEPGQYELYFLLNTFTYDLRFNFPEVENLHISFGVNGMQQSSENKGEEFLIPEYNLFDIGAFTILKKSLGKLDLSGGLRFDSRFENSNDLFLDLEGKKVENLQNNTIQKFKGFNNKFSGISGSIGGTYQISKSVFTKLNLSRGFRAPNIAELASNGVHEGTVRYEIGDPDLKAETSWQFDYAFGFNTEHIVAEINVFNNSINNFIFSRKLSSTLGGDSISEGVGVFKFVSGNARLYGGEARIDIHPHPLDWLHFENAFSYVQATQNNEPDSTKYLPFIPAPKLLTTLRADFKKIGSKLQNVYLKFELENYFRQNKFYAAYNTETETPSYTLINIGAGTDFKIKERIAFSLYISANNIADIAYQSHLSRLKYAAVNNATGRTGVFNMGRNVSFKLIVPLSF